MKKAELARALARPSFPMRMSWPLQELMLQSFQMATTLRARFDGKVFVPLDVVDLPVGEVLTFHRDASEPAVPTEEKTDLQRLAEKLASYPSTDLPPDYSGQHDHYLYGMPKRADA